ncbi:MAG: ABC transporter substrate-binding protein [Stellaceae bacterium]
MTARNRWITRAAAIAALALVALPAGAAERIVSGTLGGQAPLWPFYIAIDKGFLAADGIDLEINFSRSPSQVVQQLTAGSTDVAISVGTDGPLEAIDKGASLAIVRIIGQVPAYALIAKKNIATMADLRGKTVASGSPVDITTVYLKLMLGAVGLKPSDYQTVSFGVSAARYAALQAGEADAAMVLPPLNFRAEKLGYHTIGLPADYVHDLPFTCMAVLKPWAETHKDAVKRLIDVTTKSIAWFNDPKNREAAVEVLVKVGKSNHADAESSYDFLKRINYFAPGPEVSRKAIENLIETEQKRGLLRQNMTVDRAVLKGVTQLAP